MGKARAYTSHLCKRTPGLAAVWDVNQHHLYVHTTALQSLPIQQLQYNNTLSQLILHTRIHSAHLPTHRT